MTLKPSLSQKQNPKGFTPIHLALQHDQERMPLCLVQINKDLIQLKGRDDFTPLHLASRKEEADDELSYLHLKVGTDVAEDGIPPPLHLASRMGETELLDKFLEVCPDSIEDVNTRSETALHIIAAKHGAKHGRYGALKVLFRWLVRNSKEDDRQFIRTTTLNWKDEKGNSILHVAALYNRIKEECNAYLVVTTLIATATYQVALSPHGGLYQTHVGTNNTVMSHVAASSSSINFKSTT
ncbi:ankyrin repeat-containing protein BDA1-like [Glycine max]|uniref:ankyrin repeat-containing protein BDA1-like n=1 Tax=Glycine max TaxID=3847 RepID=UPI00071935E8|nr:ankyrin repeat-containing protein BDA1-like [Glycine max]|eukprot:XP_014632518.1 ankyrin repeat-containing protein BDA1-like [Glycine max]